MDMKKRSEEAPITFDVVGKLEGCFYERFQSAKIDKKGIIEGILPFVASLTLL